MAVEAVLGTYTSKKMASIGAGGVAARNMGARVRTLNDSAVIPALADIASTVKFGRIPLSAVILSPSRIGWAALGASTTLAFGVSDDATKGISGKTAALVAATSSSSASALAQSAISAVAISNTGKRLWEILGLTSDPGGDAELVMTLAGAASTAGGAVAVDLLFAND